MELLARSAKGTAAVAAAVLLQVAQVWAGDACMAQDGHSRQLRVQLTAQLRLCSRPIDFTVQFPLPAYLGTSAVLHMAQGS
jgi:hypothetical protein